MAKNRHNTEEIVTRQRKVEVLVGAVHSGVLSSGRANDDARRHQKARIEAAMGANVWVDR